MLSGLKNRKGFSPSPRGWKSRIEVLEILISGENFFLVLQMFTFFLLVSIYDRESESLGVSFSSYKDISSIKLDPHAYDFI